MSDLWKNSTFMEKHYANLWKNSLKEKNVKKVWKSPLKQINYTDLWNELHLRALEYKGNDTIFINNFGKKIPRFTTGCKCKEHWVKWVKANPPTFGPKYFDWTVRIHNSVNQKLGKPTYTTSEAKAFYQK